jgi:hypothetical protein
MRKTRTTNSRNNEAVNDGFTSDISRRDVLLGGAAVLLTTAVPSAAAALTNPGASSQHSGDMKMDTITTKDGVTIFYKDWGTGQAIVFSHGWPLTADDWDTQMTFFLSKGFRVIAHDRRGHGRSTQVATGHDMDHYADDLAALTAHLNLNNAIHVGHSTGGGEVTRYIGRHGESRVAKAVLISSVPPIMVKTPQILEACPRRSSTDFKRKPTITEHSSFWMCQPVPFMATTGQVRKCPRASS